MAVTDYFRHISSNGRARGFLPKGRISFRRCTARRRSIALIIASRLRICGLPRPTACTHPVVLRALPVMPRIPCHAAYPVMPHPPVMLPPPVMLRVVAASRKRPQKGLIPKWLDSATARGMTKWKARHHDQAGLKAAKKFFHRLRRQSPPPGAAKGQASTNSATESQDSRI